MKHWLCAAMLAAHAWPAAAHAQEPLEVEVLGAHTPIDERADPTPAAYVLRGDDLAAPGLSAAEALLAVPGVQVTRSGGGSDLATALVRGASSAQTPIELAGVRLNDELTGTVDLSTVPLWIVDRVEIYRGNAPYDADRYGIGGAVRFEPRLPRARGVEAAGALGGGSFGEREGRASLALGDGSSGALVAMRQHAWTGDYDFVDDGGTRFDANDDVERARANADGRELELWTIGRVAVGRARVGLVLSGLSREAGAPGLQLRGARASRSALERVLGGATARLPLRPGLALELGTDVLFTRYRLDDPLGELALGPSTESAGERLGERAAIVYSPLSWLSLRAGAGAEEQGLRIDSDGEAALRARRTVGRGELAALSRFGPVRLVAAGALECHDTSAGCDSWAPAARLGAHVLVREGIGLQANAGRYARVPTLGELFGISAAVRGNPALASETGYSVDLGASAQAARRPLEGWTQLFGFVRFAEDLIAYRRSSFGALRPYNAAGARVLGLELGAGGRAWRIVRAGVALTLLDPRDTSIAGANLLPLESRFVARPELELTATPVWSRPVVERATIAVRYQHRSSRVADPAGLIVLGEQRGLDLDGALALAAGVVTVRARLANLLDQQSFDLVGYPLPGRSVHGLVEVRP